MLVTAGVGVLAAWPVRKLSGVSLAIATLSFGFIVQEVLVRWEGLTRGNAGWLLTPLDPLLLYGLTMAAALGALWGYGRLGQGRWGRALVALREDAVAAEIVGVATTRLKILSFTVAAALGGLAGALYAHQLRFISPEQFDWVMSIELLMMLVIGGLGSRAGIVLGALFLITVPQAIAGLRDLLEWSTPPAGLELFAFGLTLVLTLRWAPQGLAGELKGGRRTSLTSVRDKRSGNGQVTH
jgi:branched-chain amino acid transport system permease protein